MMRQTANPMPPPGQRMIALPEPTREWMRKNPLLSPLHVTDAGVFTRAAWHRVERPQGAPTTLLMLCLQGRGWVDCDGVKSELQPGSLAWLSSGHAHAYGADASEPWSLSWAHFDGTQVPFWKELLGLGAKSPCGFRTLPVDQLAEIELGAVYGALAKGYAPKDLVLASSRLSLILASLARLAPNSGSNTSQSTNKRIQDSVERLRLRWRENHRLGVLAAEAGLSPAHYSALFRNYTGFSPVDYVIRLRIQHACHLIDGSSLSIAEIANQVGYDDPYYFTRCFRRVMGCAPRAYRKTTKG